MAQLPQVPDATLTKWKSQLDPILANRLLQGNFLQNLDIKAGPNQVSHLLQRQPMGWIICDQTADSTFYRTSWDVNFINLVSSNATTASFWVF